MSTWGSAPWGGLASVSATAIKVSDILYHAYRIAGILSEAGRGYGAAKLDDGMAVLNAMLDAWNTERLCLHVTSRNLFTLIPSQGDYTIGDAGDFDVVRPQKIDRASTVDLSDPVNPRERPIEVITDQGWQEISGKLTTSTLPQKVWYETTYPLGILHFWPVPTAAHQAALYWKGLLAGFTNATDSVALPPGYLAAIEYNLAEELALRFPDRAKISPLALEKAREYKAAIKRANIVVHELRCDPGVLQRGAGFDIYSGE
ncbi:MAG: hypothetical protein LLG20_18500 [Acidobacteriales bacterium]|nr:hypothetical protein [Terriglobales bacterium]